MRAFEKIKWDILQTTEKSNILKEEKEKAAYATISNAVWKGVRAFIWIPLSIVFPLAPLLSIIAAIRYLRGKVKVSAAWRFAIFSGIVFFGLIATLLNNFFGKSPTLVIISSQFFSNDYVFGLSEMTKTRYGNMTADDLYRLIGLLIDFIALVPVSLVFIGSIVKYVREAKKEKACNQRIADLSAQITSCENDLNKLNIELLNTQNEAKKLFSQEEAKEKPDRKCMESLAELGYSPAQEWLKKANWLWGKQIFDEEIKKGEPDRAQIKLAADLGYPEACMYYAEPLLLEYSSDPFLDCSDELTTPESKQRLCYKLQPYFKNAADAKIKTAKFYYLYTTERAGYTKVQDYCYSNDDLRALKKAFKELIESESIDSKTRVVCEQCIERIEKVSTLRWQAKNRAELEKNSGFFSGLAMYESMVNAAAGKSPSKEVVETVEYYPVVDVTGM